MQEKHYNIIVWNKTAANIDYLSFNQEGFFDYIYTNNVKGLHAHAWRYFVHNKWYIYARITIFLVMTGGLMQANKSIGLLNYDITQKNHPFQF